MTRGRLRISGGALKGRRLRVPESARPTSSRTREALISRWRDRLAGARVLDLFAGGGAVGLEAAGHGARRVVWVEADRQALAVLAGNVRLADELDCELEILRGRLPGMRSRIAALGPFDLVFADPPYAFADFGTLIRSIAGLLAPAGEAAIEHSARVELPAVEGPHRAFQRVATRSYGGSALSFFAAGERQDGIAGPRPDSG